MKLSILFTFAMIFALQANSTFGQRNITLNVKETSISDIIDKIEANTDFKFIFKTSEVDLTRKVSITVKEEKAEKVLQMLFHNTTTGYKIIDSKILLSKNNKINKTIAIGNSKIQQLTITGKVTDANGEPLPGVTVRIKDTNRATATTFDGRYTIDVSTDNILVFTSIGFETQEVTVGIQKIINIQLKEAVNQLGEVTINAGYYNTTQRKTTGNIAKIDAKIIEKQPVNNPLAALQGQLPGVNIRQVSGVPGGGFEIDIRGQNSINGITDPLFIVNGVPFSSQSLGSNAVSSLILGGGISPLNAINPNDIESIEILKDADATAIYGSRGANGVVLITTKKGKVGKTQFNANLNTSISQVSNFLKLMNTEQYLEIRKEGITNDGYSMFLENSSFDFIWPDVKSWDNSRYTDWQKELIGGTALRNNAQLSITGGSEQTQFLITGAFQKETTVFPGESNYKKATLFNNINHKSKDDRFKLNFSTIYTNENNKLPVSDFTHKAYTLEPNAPKLYDEGGNLNWENNTWENPLASLKEDYQVKINTFITNTMISYLILPNLELKSSFGLNTYRLDSYKTLPSSARNPSLGLTSQNSSLTTNSSNRQSWSIEPQLNWKKEWKNTKIDILFGTTFQSETTKQLVQKGTGFPNNSLIYNLVAAETLEALQNTDSEYKYQAVFGRLNLNLFEKYILNITGRRDGSSRFGPGKKFGNFGAIGFAWLFSKEKLFKDNSILSFGKLRSSYGITGSDNIGDYRYLDTYNVTGGDYDGTTIIEPTGVFNPLFGWEENRKLEIGLELGFLNNSLQLNTSWYQNRSSNQLVGIPLAATTGFSELTGNFDATVQNTGFEIDLRTINIQKGNFKWTTTFNLTAPKNKLVKFDGLETSTFANKYIIGESLSIVKLYHALGVDPNTGEYLFEDYNDDGGISSLKDKQWVEDLAPKFYGGLGNTFSYKNLSLDFFFQFKKQKAFNELAFRATPGYRGNTSVSLLDRWQIPGDTNPIKMASGGLSLVEDTGNLQSSSSAAVSDASFIRLRNVSINYKLPNLKNGLNVNIYVQGQNLLTFTNYNGPDPEQPSNTRLPQLRQITFGLQLGF